MVQKMNPFFYIHKTIVCDLTRKNNIGKRNKGENTNVYQYSPSGKGMHLLRISSCESFTITIEKTTKEQ